MAKDWLKKLQGLEGAVVGDHNPHNHVLTTPWPSVNFTFGRGHGLPRGYGLALYGPPKGGKTVFCNAMSGQTHRDFSDDYVIKFDTELREEGQLTTTEAEKWGIDRDRYLAYSVNSPMLIFDRIETEIAAMCQEGMPLALVIIDSLTGIQGRRAMNADSIETQQIGDHALTVQEGLKRILPIHRKYKFAVIVTCHVRAEMDMLEQKRGNKVKMAASFGVQHWAEYFMFIGPNRNADARADMAGNKFENDEVKDFAGKGDQTGHKIKATMKDNSFGPKGRSGEFTIDYNRGPINIHEEIFQLAEGRGVLERRGNTTWIFGDREWTGGRPAMLQAIKDDHELGLAIVKEVNRRDTAGFYAVDDAKAAAEENAQEEEIAPTTGRRKKSA